MQRIVLLLLLLNSASLYGQSKNPFLHLKFDRVVLYDYEQYAENPALVEKGQILKNVTIKKQVLLDKATANLLTVKLSERKS